MEYLCRKACTFGSRKYYAGDHIPEGVVLPQRERTLVGMGYITPASPLIEPTKAAGQQPEENALKKKKGEAGA